jgi:hypothetical protein
MRQVQHPWEKNGKQRHRLPIIPEVSLAVGVSAILGLATFFFLSPQISSFFSSFLPSFLSSSSFLLFGSTGV